MTPRSQADRVGGATALGTSSGVTAREEVGRLLPGQRIEVTGFNVLRIGTGPWCVLFNPSSLTVGDNVVVALDHRLFLGTALPATGTLIDVGTFKLAVVAGSHPPSCQVVIDHGVWSFSLPGYRPDVITAFDRFLVAAEALEKTTLQAGATEVLRSIVAQQVPATYAECLYMAHGVFSQDNPAQTYFDVQPGMRLRFDFEDRQFVPPNTGASVLSGFVGGSTVTTDVVGLTSPSGAPKVGVDAFLSAVRLPPVGVAQGGFGDVIDLAAALTSAGTSSVPGQPHRLPSRGLRHIRFCYPARAFPGADSSGTVGPAGNIAVLGADDLTTLANATNTYYASGDPGAPLLGYFRGRAVIQPLIPILINGVGRHFVPVGTTARQLLERFALVPRFPGFLDEGASTALNYQRRQNGVDISSLYGSACYSPVTMAAGDLDSAGADALDFPILAADVFTYPASAGHG